MSPGDLERALCGMNFTTNANVLVGLENPDDAGVYKITDDIAMIQTVDFFTPIVDNPYHFGQIAAANALSDIYAMGGIPKTAMNLVCFPVKDLAIDILREIIKGGHDKLKEADVVLLGGHSIEDQELKYGLSVTGFIHPKALLTKHNITAGDRLVLTKPIGTGIINTAIKGGLASTNIVESAIHQMSVLNKKASEIMLRHAEHVHACTDITGFGLLGHLAEMITGSGLSATIQMDHVPILDEAYSFAGMGLVPAGTFKNREFRKDSIVFAESVNPIMQDILFDPQTSGGLLISIAEERADSLVDELRAGGIRYASAIGRITDTRKNGTYKERTLMDKICVY